MHGLAAATWPVAIPFRRGHSNKIAGTISERLSFGLKLLEPLTWQSLTQDKGSLLPTRYGNCCVPKTIAGIYTAC